MAAYSDFSVPFYGVTLLTYSVFAQPLYNSGTTVFRYTFDILWGYSKRHLKKLTKAALLLVFRQNHELIFDLLLLYF